MQEKDKNSISLDLMHRMKMNGMVAAFQESIQSTVAESMTPDGFLSWLLAREWDYRANAAIERLIKGASFRYKAYLEEIDYGVSRGLDLGSDGTAPASLDFVSAGQRSTSGRFAQQRTCS